MSTELYAVAGCKIYIGGVQSTQTDDFTKADFAGETWVEIDGWSQMGAFGDTATLITTPLINRGRDTKQKGTRNAGTMENVFAVIPDDAGQTALLAAEKTSRNYAFKIELNDTPETGVSPAPSKRYFIGLVMKAQEQGGEANVSRKLSASVEINSNIVAVAATKGA